MPASNFEPEIRAAMDSGGNPRKPPSGVPEREPPQIAQQERQMARDSAGETDRTPRAPGPGRGNLPHPPQQRTAMPMPSAAMGHPDLPHVAAAASIAHAILGNRGMR